jgi:hypothetical protein
MFQDAAYLYIAELMIPAKTIIPAVSITSDDAVYQAKK